MDAEKYPKVTVELKITVELPPKEKEAPGAASLVGGGAGDEPVDNEVITT